MSRHSQKSAELNKIESFNEMLRFCRDSFGEQTAFSFKCGKDEKKTVSFGKFYSDVKKLGGEMTRLGLSGKRIALISENSYEWIACYFACVCLGGATVPLDKELSETEISVLLKRSGTKAVVYSKSYAEKAAAAAEENGLLLLPLSEVRRIIDEAESGFEFEKNMPSDTLASIVFTSGTTGDSKGVMLTHKNLVSNAVSAAEAVENYKKCLLILPAHHTFGLVAGVFVPMLKGFEIFISSSTKQLTKDIAFFRPQAIIVVPVMAETIYKKIWAGAEANGKSEKLRKAMKLSSFLRKFGIDLRRKLFKEIIDPLGGELEGIVCGGAAVDIDCAKGFNDFGIDFFSGYGITECSPIVSVNRKKANKFGSVGQALSCNSVRITEKDDNGVGNIEVKGSNVFSGYLDGKQNENESFDKAWFKTGDLGRLDKDGFLYLTGRKKNLIILSNGKNVSPEELESSLIHNKYISEVVVYEKEQKITAEIFPDRKYFDGQTEKNIYNAVDEFNKTVPAYKNIEKVIIRNSEFPKTSTMKIKRKYEAEKGDESIV
ncbi:MAG: AMP-binding protein [Acutalibacteraceae bacterium]